MKPGLSLYLDALRFGAALVVLLSHFAYPRFSDGRWLWVRELNLGSDAVIVFFVLSGLVIAHVAARPDATGPRFAFDRATRLVSVALPAIILTFTMDRIGSQLAPAVYAAPFYQPMPLWEMLLRGLTFSNEWGISVARLGSNGPYWSLSYEATYFALFGVAVFTRGARRFALLILLGLVAGLTILLLLPVWLMGVGLHVFLARGHTPSDRLSWTMALVPVLIYSVALWLNLPGDLRAFTFESLPRLALRFSDEFIWNTVLGLLVTCHIAGMAGLLRSQRTWSTAGVIRWGAGRSFSIYLVHYPVLQFLESLPLRDIGPWQGDVTMIGLTLVICLAFGSIFEAQLPKLRAALRNRGLGLSEKEA
ncbi:acyltransferase [uncultured Roseovarius sp.]|uniref:acyltransferase family protein n=1 Tax=uncultured Roseovarius sp. TaxID=293344 RepID=UPI0026025BFB|nr:acyltransferase [uncultured Roseovarius sp.]